MTRNFKLYLTIFELIKEGKNPSQIAKQLNISKQKLSYYTKKLKERSFIQKKGYGTWEVKRFNLSHIELFPKKSIRGHAFIWKVKLHKKIDWLKKLGTTKYKLIGRAKYPRIFINNKKVWLGKRNIVIFENKSFYAKNSINSRKYAVYELLDVLRALESKLCVNLRPYTFKVTREHYGMIKNELARQCNKNGEKIIVHDDLEGGWMWIDDSHSLNELEVGGKKAVLRSKQVQDWFNDHKKHDFKVTPSFLLESIGGLTQNFNEYSKHIKSHTKAIKALSEAMPQLINVIKDLKKENKDLKQRKLNEF